MEQKNSDAEREIDLMQLMILLWKNIRKIVLVGLAAVVLFEGINAFKIITKVSREGKYAGTAKIYVAQDVPKTASVAIITYFTSHDLLNGAINDLHLNLTVSELNSMINLENSTETLVTINVYGDDEASVKNITDYLAAKGIKQINNFGYNSARLIEPAYASANTDVTFKYVINKIIKYGLAGFLLGAFMVIGVYSFLFINDSSIKNESDVRYYLGVPVLGTIPAIEGTREYIDKDKKNKKQRLSQYSSEYRLRKTERKKRRK